MKKLLKIFSFCFIFFAIFAGISSASNCVNQNVGRNSICVSIEKGNNNRYTLDSDISCREYPCAVSCSIMLPDNTLAPVGSCNGKFYYNSNSSEKVKLYITMNGDFATITRYYNFRNGTRGSVIDDDDYYDYDDDDYYDYDDDYYYSYVEISTNNKNPSTSEYIRLTIDTDDDYYGKVYLSAKYRSSTSSSWTSVSNTSSTYFSNYSDEWEQGYYKMKSSDNGHKVISNLLKFSKKGYYRDYAKDTNGNEDYIDFYVSNSSSYYNDDLEISASTTSPSVGTYVKLTIDTDYSYVGNVSFYKVQYRSSSSSSWNTISSRTNSTYFSNYSDEWEQGYYKMKSSDNGHKVISNFIKFAKKGYYRIYARDVDGNEDYIEFNVGGSSYYYDDLDLSTSDKNPNASEYVDLTVNTDSSYRGKIYFTAKYRSSTSNSWSDISRTSSTYFINRSTTWNNGYLTMGASDRGEKTVSNIFKFAKKGYYRITAEDENGNSVYLDFNVGNSSSSPLNGFTQKEFDMVERIYNVRPTLISNLRSQYPRLRNNSTWRSLSDELYENMEDVVYKRSNREFQDYDDFERAFRYWFTRTQELMD